MVPYAKDLRLPGFRKYEFPRRQWKDWWTANKDRAVFVQRPAQSFEWRRTPPVSIPKSFREKAGECQVGLSLSSIWLGR
jgi:hypothetical protein